MVTNGKKSAAGRDVKPVIFIGLGSSGAKIVSKLSEYLDKNADEFAKRFYRYYLITSEVDPEDGTSKEISRFPLARKQLSPRQAINPLWETNDTVISAEFRKWWYTEKAGAEPWIPPVKSLDTGSGGMRSIGRALLHSKCLDSKESLIDNFAGILRSLESEVERLHDVEDRADVHMSSIDCYVFGLLAGGTCSGTLLDLAFLLKAGFGSQTNLFGIFLLGDICYDGIPYKELKPITKHIQLTNTTYALAELALVQSNTGFDIICSEWPRRIGRLDLSGDAYKAVFDQKPFNSIALVGAKNDDGFSFNKSGNQFNTYLDFIAKYYSDFFTSDAVYRQVGRTVDKSMASAQRIDARYPSRPNDFQRVGYMCIQVPKDKIRTLLRYDISETIGVNMFKNADAQRCKALLDTFFTRVGLDVLASDQSEFAPSPRNEPIIPVDEPLPDTAQDFETQWKQTEQSVIDFYAPRTSSDSKEIQELVQKYRDTKWRPALNDLLDDLLGQKAGQPLSIGSAKWAIETLLQLINERMAQLTAREKQLQAQLFREGPSSLKAQFDACLQQETSEFPPKSIFNPLALLARRSWPGASNVAQTLRAFKDGLRQYAIAVAAGAALEPLHDELTILAVVRKLIAHYAARSIFETNRTAAAAIFTESSTAGSITQEILSDRESIEKCFVQPILMGPASSDTTTSRKALAMEQVLIEWSGTDLGGIKSAWGAIADHLRAGSKKVQDAEVVIRNDVIKRTIDRLRDGLMANFTEQSNRVFEPAVEDLSVWDALRLYVEKTGDDPDSVLKKLFTVYLRRAKHFTKLNGNQDADTAFTPSPDVLYLCSVKDAQKCFADLGLKNPENYLTQLMEQALSGGSIYPMESENPPHNEIQLFLVLNGELPYFYEGFEGVIKLLLNPPVQETGDEKNWSDARFPEWIRRWWADPDPKKQPYFLQQLVGAKRT
jgi:hypothetical protein